MIQSLFFVCCACDEYEREKRGWLRLELTKLHQSRKSMKGLTENEKEKCMDRLITFQIYLRRESKLEEIVTDEKLWPMVTSLKEGESFVFLLYSFKDTNTFLT